MMCFPYAHDVFSLSTKYWVAPEQILCFPEANIVFPYANTVVSLGEDCGFHRQMLCFPYANIVLPQATIVFS